MKDQMEEIYGIPDLDYRAEVRKCKTMEDVVGKNGLMQRADLKMLYSNHIEVANVRYILEEKDMKEIQMSH